MIGLQALQAAVHGFQNMFFRKIEGARPDAAFALQYHLFAQAGSHAQGFGELCFRLPAAVNIGVIKKIDASIQGGMDQGRNFLF